MTAAAQALIADLGLAAHPEGGWFRETWRAAPGPDGRARGTAILFLLAAGEASHWHRVDADELWLWQGGDPLELRIAESDTGPVRALTLGGDPRAGQALQALVPGGAWQAARPAAGGTAGYCLMACVVVPGFDFAHFELAPEGWEPLA